MSQSSFFFPGLLIHVDKRITLAAFKQNLEPYVGVQATQFKVFRVYANNQEFESVRLNETLSSFSDDNKVYLFWPLTHYSISVLYFSFFKVFCCWFFECFFFINLQITIRLGRALKKGEYRVKVYQLLVNEAEVSSY